MSNITISVADAASDKDADGNDKPSVARRGYVAGKHIATKPLADGVSHSCVVPDTLTVGELDAFVEDSFLNVDPADPDVAKRPLADISAEDLADMRATVALKREQDQSRKAREAAARAARGG